MDKMEKLTAMRHSLSHILMHALKRLYGATPGVGPAIENGFYHDFDSKHQVKEEDLTKIEVEMRRIIKENLKIEKKVMAAADGIKELERLGYHYTAEMARELEIEGQMEISFFQQGDFINMCKGPHLESTGLSGEFQLTRIAGAYWKGDERNKMLQRIYGVAFSSKKELKSYLAALKEAEKRDHRKLGKELDLFCFSDLVGPGLPLFTPNGVTIIDELKRYVESICRDYGFEKVSTPHLAKIDLFEISGHAKKFSDELFRVSSGRGHELVMKPVQCPHQTQIYASRKRSYRDLPIRYMESERQYRAEKPGEVGGLNRVYAITLEDGHSFCRVEQVKREVMNMVSIIKDFYSALGMWGKHWVSLSVRDYSKPEKYIGEEKDWDACEQMLQEVSDEMGLKEKKCEGEAALYGPKLDFMFKDALNKEVQIPTVQLDFATPKRFKLYYINEKGKEESPVMVHRAILGSYERFLVLLIEHFGGAFPVWLSPLQVKIISVGSAHAEHCLKISKKMKELGIRAGLDDSNETVGNKIRKAINEKTPYMLVIGDKEMKQGIFNVRKRGKKELQEMKQNDFIEMIREDICGKKVW